MTATDKGYALSAFAEFTLFLPSDANVRGMLAAFDALLAEPLLMLLVLGVGAAIGLAVEKFLAGIERERRRAYYRGRKIGEQRNNQSVTVTKTGASLADAAADQLKAIMRADFKPRALLNKSEARVFRVLDKLVIARNPDWQVMAQVCVGEFLSSDDAEAFRCINSKRVDLLLMDEACRARHALEYQGTGHHQGTAAARDAVKKEALRKAGVGYHEVVSGHTTPAELRQLVEKLVPPRQPLIPAQQHPSLPRSSIGARATR